MTPLLPLLLACQLGAQAPVYSGTVEVTEVHVSAVVAGRIQEVSVREGDAVEAGSPLFSVDTALLDAQLALRQQQIAQAEAAVAAAKAQLGAASEQVRVLQRESERMNALQAAGVGTAQAASTLDGQLRVARAQRLAAEQLIAQAEAGLGQATAGHDAARIQLEEASVSAPLAGVVLSRDREPGEVIAPGMSVITLGDMAHPRLRVYLPLVQLERVSLGQQVQVRLDAAPDAPITGTITWVSPRSEFTPRDILTPDERVKRVFAVDVSLPPSPGLHPGVPAEALFPEV
ncbi:MAG: HlyD family efflux transporter periplasmic adaptor subunit [Deltaproteobacteria bacterium]|nr:HlyD family efflux transporter periplasmic adaptor subunit [Deltaproteobacteria bacterium]